MQQCMSQYEHYMAKLRSIYLVETGDKKIEQFWDKIAG